ncbi:MAG: hypothetical protein J4469_00030 [Candidatus Aenigmarchaeota archaeon]|nr:hypothetical protein [Candidatus Aenigmarchaeota archaeon]
MQVEETLLTRRIIIETKDPYSLALELMEAASQFGNIVEKENKYETDGPERKTTLNFEIVENTDRASHLVVEFNTLGETNSVNYLGIDITARFVCSIMSEGFFSSAFTDYYLKHLFPRYLKSADDKIKRIDKAMVDFAEAASKKARQAKAV